MFLFSDFEQNIQVKPAFPPANVHFLQVLESASPLDFQPLKPGYPRKTAVFAFFTGNRLQKENPSRLIGIMPETGYLRAIL